MTTPLVSARPALVPARARAAAARPAAARPAARPAVARAAAAVAAATLLAAGLVAGCAAAPDGERAPRPSPNRITAAELEGREHLSALDAIQALRPRWLVQRGSTSIHNPEGGEVVVYLDGARTGGLQALRSLRADQVGSMEFLDGRDATTRFGTGHPGGAILVTTRRH